MCHSYGSDIASSDDCESRGGGPAPPLCIYERVARPDCGITSLVLVLDRVSSVFSYIVYTPQSASTREDTMAARVALLVVDMQEDFCPPVRVPALFLPYYHAH